MVQRKGGGKKAKRSSHSKKKAGKHEPSADQRCGPRCECLECLGRKRRNIQADISAALLLSAEGLFLRCQEDELPSNPQELYQSYLPSKGLHVSRVIQGGTALYTNPSRRTNTAQPPANSSSPASTSFNVDTSPSTSCCNPSTSEDSDVADATHQLTPQAYNTAEEFVEACLCGQVPMLPVPVPQPGDHVTNKRARQQLTPQTASESAAAEPATASASASEATEDRYRLQELPSTTEVVVVSGQGSTFSGLLSLPCNACMVFDTSCSDAVLSDCVARGGMVVCYGRGCHVTCTNVHFLGCPVTALAGATVTFYGCTFSPATVASPASPSTYAGAAQLDAHALAVGTPPLAVLAHACGTHVSLDSCCVLCHAQLNEGVVVCQGARAEISRTSLSGAKGAAIDVSGAGSELDANNCVIQGEREGSWPTDRTAKPPDRGIVLRAGSSAQLNGTIIEDSGVGFVASACTAVLRDCVVSFAWITCIDAEADSDVQLHGCLLEDAMHYELGHGARVSGGGKIAMHACTMQRNRHSGVHACEHSTAFIVGCTSRENAEAGYAAEGPGSELYVTDCTAVECDIGVWAFDSQHCKLEGVTTDDIKQSFVFTGVQGSAVVANCKAEGFQEVGVVVRGKGAQAEVTDSVIRGRLHGLYVQEGGRVKVGSSSMHVGEVSLGIAVGGEGSQVSAESCNMSGGIGAHADEGAELCMERCATSNCVKYGVVIAGHSRALLRSCISDSNPTALLVKSSHVVAETCEFRDFRIGAEFVGASAAVLRACKFNVRKSQDSASAGVGLFVRGGGVNLNLSGVSVRGTQLSSLRIIESGASVRMVDCVLADSQESGLQISGESCTVHMTGCTLKGHARFGVSSSGGDVVIEHTHTTKNRVGGYAVFERGSMSLSQCSSDMDGAGFTALGEGGKKKVKGMPKAVLKKVFVRRARGFGFGVFNGVKCCMQHCSALSCGMQGVSLQGCFDGRPNVCVSVFDCMFQKNAKAGAMVSRGAIVSMSNVMTSENKGSGFQAEGVGTQLKLSGCESYGNGGSAYAVDVDAKLNCSQCSGYLSAEAASELLESKGRGQAVAAS